LATRNFDGGDKLKAKLEEIAKGIKKGATLRVGFFEDATYPDGQFVANIAAIQEWGATIKVPAHTVSIYRKLKADGEWARGGKFVKRKDANVQTDHSVPAHTITIPPRPFFRNMINANQDTWGPTLAALLKENGYDSKQALGALGEDMVGQLKESINTFTDPPNAPSTIAGKGFDKPLIHTGQMVDSVSKEVT
jgi:hypothetical protein